MSRGSRFGRNIQLSTVVPSEPEQPVSPKGTPAISNVGPPDAPAPDAPIPTPASTDGLFQQFIKVYLENQNQARPPAPIQGEFREQSLKARFPDFYHRNSHLDCYRFCQQCEDHFETAGANGSNRISFPASFLRGAVAQWWHQHKRRSAEEAPITWAKFKSFLQTNLGDDRAFANSICSKFRRDFEYQAESVLDWATHLEYLQSILLEYDLAGAPGELTMLRYFWEGLWPSIRVELEHRDLELESFEQLLKKVVEAEGKASLRPRTTTREMDQHCSRGSRPTIITVAKVSTPSSSIKDPRVEEPKVRTQEATPLYYSKSIETSDR